jgi:hypothetical protein
MSLVYGQELSHDECRLSRRAFVHWRTLRDPPGACLPLPPLQGRMVPVTLSPEESQTLALSNALGESLGAFVRLCVRACVRACRRAIFLGGTIGGVGALVWLVD